MPSVPEIQILAQSSALPFVNEIIQHPDFTQIAAFFSGWVFISSVLSIARSPAIKGAVRLFTGYLSVRFSAPSTSPVATGHDWRTLDRQYPHRDDDHHHDHFLILLLFTCFALSSIAYFTSLLTYSAEVSSFVCAFVIASGGVFAGCGRLFGVFTLVLEFWRLGANMKEMLILTTWILSAVALLITEYSISVGTSGLLPPLGTYICYRIRDLPISLAGLSVNLVIEVYILIRLLWLIPRDLLGSRRRITALRDTRSLRTSSLIVLELLEIIPTVTFPGRIGEIVPVAIGSLLVLAAFNKPVDYQASRLGTPNLTPLRSPQGRDTLPHLFQHARGHPRHGIPAVMVNPPPTLAARKGSLTNLEKPSRVSTIRDSSWRKAPPQGTSTPPPRSTKPIRGDHGIASDNPTPSKGQWKNRIVDHLEVFVEVEKAIYRGGLPIPPPLRIRIPGIVPLHNDSPKRHSNSSPSGGSDIIRRGTFNHTHPPRTSIYLATERSPTTFKESRSSSMRSPASNSPSLSSKHSNGSLMLGGNGTSPTRRMTFSDLSMVSAGDRSTFGGRRPRTYKDLVARMNSIPKERIAVQETDKAMATLQRNYEINLAQHRSYTKLLRTRIRGPRPLLKVVAAEI